MYLDEENLKKNIEKRGRSYEKNIELDYLKKIQSGYFDYIKQHQDMRVLIVDTNRIDFVENESDYLKLLGIIDQNYSKGIHRFTLE